MSHYGEPWMGTSYRNAPVATAPRAPKPVLSRPLAGAIAAAALIAALGVAVGLAAQPRLGHTTFKRPAHKLAIEVARPRVMPTPKAVGRLEVLPPDMVRNAPRAMPRPAAAAALEADRFGDQPEPPFPSAFDEDPPN